MLNRGQSITTVLNSLGKPGADIMSIAHTEFPNNHQNVFQRLQFRNSSVPDTHCKYL